MTLEEAGQTILEGVKWVECPGGCDGGWFYEEGYTSPAVECNVCKGTGNTLDPAYEEACIVLSKPVPERPSLLAYRLPRLRIIEDNSVKDIEKALRDT